MKNGLGDAHADISCGFRTGKPHVLQLSYPKINIQGLFIEQTFRDGGKDLVLSPYEELKTGLHFLSAKNATATAPGPTWAPMALPIMHTGISSVRFS